MVELEAAFSSRSWRPVRRTETGSTDILAEEPYGDFPLEDSFEEVTAALMAGEINSETYDRLVLASRLTSQQ